MGIYPMLLLLALGAAAPRAQAEELDFRALVPRVNAAVRGVTASARALAQKRAEMEARRQGLKGREPWRLPPRELAAYNAALRGLQEDALALRKRLTDALAEYARARRPLERRQEALRALREEAAAAHGRIAQAPGLHPSNQRRALEAIAADLALLRKLEGPCELAEDPEVEGGGIGPLLELAAVAGPGAGPRGFAGSEAGLIRGYLYAEDLVEGFALEGLGIAALSRQDGRRRVAVCSLDPELAGLGRADVAAAAGNLKAIEGAVRSAKRRKLRRHPWPGLDPEALFGKVAEDPAIDLTGRWHGANYNCETEGLTQIVEVVQAGGEVRATKLPPGDGCVHAGQITWKGGFDGFSESFPVQVQVAKGVGEEQYWIEETAELSGEGPDSIRIGPMTFSLMD